MSEPEAVDLSEPEAAANGEFDVSEPASEEPDPQAPDLNSMKRSLDGYGREIWVERQDDRGKPVRWYEFDTAGNLFRHERKGLYTIVRDLVPNFGANRGHEVWRGNGKR